MVTGANNSESIQSVASRVASALKFCEERYGDCLVILIASQTVTSVAQCLYVGANLKHHSRLPPPLASTARPLDRVAGTAVNVAADTSTSGVVEIKREINVYDALHLTQHYCHNEAYNTSPDTSVEDGTFTAAKTIHPRPRFEIHSSHTFASPSKTCACGVASRSAS